MKTIPLLLIVTALCLVPNLNGQDAATDERLNKLSAQIEDLRAAQELQQKRIVELAKEIDSLRERLIQANPAWASQDDLRKLAENLQEVDKKRESDKELILKEIEKLGKTLGSATAGKKPSVELKPAAADKSGAGGEKGYEHVIQSGDTLEGIAKAFGEKGIKVTSDQILKANPGLKATSLKPGQKIFIPAPAQ